MAASAVDISNLALGHFGDEAAVAAISPPEATVQAEQCAKYYPIARDAVLEAHAWTFNTRRANLTLLAESPVGSWTFAYSLPANCLRVLAVHLPESTDDSATQDFVIESLGDGELVLYTNVENAWAHFLERVTDTSKFPPAVVIAMSRLLSSFVAGPIIKGKVGVTVAAAMLRRFEESEFPRAKELDSAGRKVSSSYANYKPVWIRDR